MTFIETIQYIRNTIAAYFNPRAQVENAQQSLNNALATLALIAVDTAQVVEHLRTAGLAIATNPNMVTAATRVSDALGVMQADAEVVFNTAVSTPIVIVKAMQLLPALKAIRDLNDNGIPNEQAFPLFIAAFRPLWDAVMIAASHLPAGQRLQATAAAAFAQLSNNQNLQNALIRAFDAFAEMITESYRTQQVHAENVTNSSQTLQAAILELASLVDRTAESTIQAHTTAPPATPILNAAPGGRRRKPGQQEASSDQEARNDKKIDESIASQVKRKKR